ncbi:MAG: M4 family metallopeptidase [Thermodesulfobacteriota bacterium]
MAESTDPEVRRLGIQAMAAAAAIHSMRTTLSRLPGMAVTASPQGAKYRLVYDMKHSSSIFSLPGELVRSEGQAVVNDEAADEAYDFSGHTYDFYKDVLGRNSLDNRGMSLISSVHLGTDYNNAFWNGEQMAYGDGDGKAFLRFTKALEVVGHELTHGVVSHSSNLEYRGQSGALNEHFADVLGVMVKQWHLRQSVDQANWSVGGELLGPAVNAKALRTFKAEKAFENDPLLGTDPQPKHMDQLYTGWEDNGGVHINSGIPNHAFYLVAVELKGNAWEKAGKIWYKTLLALDRHSDFAAAAKMTHQIAGSEFGSGSAEQDAVKAAWKAVGLSVW